jgi:putative heme-binding domain-containing protein
MLEHPSEFARVHSMWTLLRLGRLTDDLVDRARQDSSELVRIHAWRVLSELSPRRLDLDALTSPRTSPMVRRAAAGAVAQHPGCDVARLLALLEQAPAPDAWQRHAWRLAIRNQLRAASSWEALQVSTLSPSQETELASIAVAVPGRPAAEFLLDHVRRRDTLPQLIESQLSRLCADLDAGRLPEAIEIVRGKSRHDVELQLKLLPLIQQRLQQRSRGTQPPALRTWALELAVRLLSLGDTFDGGWRRSVPANPWGLEKRNCDDGATNVTFLSSLPGGERATGSLRSFAFVVPPRLSFYLCGHLGLPDQPARDQSHVQLRLADRDEVIARALPPRSDTARQVDWDLSQHAGKWGYLEIVDGLELASYAWLAVARFEPAVAAVPELNPARRAHYQAEACSLVAALELAELQPLAARMLNDTSSDWAVRSAAARALLAFSPRPIPAALAPLVAEPSIDDALRAAVCDAIARPADAAATRLLSDVMKAAPARVQRQLADSLAATPEGAESLLLLVEQGHAAPQLLQDPALKQKLVALRVTEVPDRIARLTASLPSPDRRLLRLLEDRRRGFRPGSVDAGRGKELFQKHCAACHQVGGQGALIAPQLDGVGGRGVERIIEDVLDPNRNVDAAFHVSVFALTNGQVVTGLLRREEGASFVLANQEGKEFAVLKGDIGEQTRSGISLMPGNYAELLRPDEFSDLIGYLLTLRPGPGR